MKKIIAFRFIILFFIVYSSNLIISQPKITFNISGGYSMPLQDFKTAVPGNGTDSTLFPYELRNGYNFGAVGKLAIGKKGNIKLILGFNFNGFTNSVDLPNVYYPENNYRVTFISHVNIITISLGGEYDFLPKGKINPFAGLDITANIWNGSFRFDNSGDTLPLYYPVNMKSEARFGLQVGGGVEYSLGKEIGIVAGFKYNAANLVGKGHSDASAIQPTEVALNDKAFNGSPAKNISYLQIYGGISFYFAYPPGNPKK